MIDEPRELDVRAAEPQPRSRGRSPQPSGSRGAWAIGLLNTFGILLVLVALIAIVASLRPAFVSGDYLLNLLQQWAPIGLMAMAGTFVMIGGGFDLSVGGIFVLAGSVYAGVTRDDSLVLGVIAALGVGGGLGLVNGLVVTKAKVNPLIATIGMGQIAGGLALIYTAATPIIVTNSPGFTVIGQHKVGPFPLPAVIMIVAFLVGGLVLSRSVYGRSVYAIGGNPLASRLSGLRVDAVLTGTYVISGTVAGLAGLIYASRLGVGQADVAAGIELNVIIAIVLGGTAVGGGLGAMWRTAVGVAILAVLQNGLDTLDIQSFYQDVIKGAILIGAVGWDVWSRQRRSNAPPATALVPSAQGG